MQQPKEVPSVEPPLRDVPIDWEALENAFENNAPEVHSYLQVITGDVLRVVDGVADPQMHARIAADPNYLRIEAVSSREQYRWMERYIPTVEDANLRTRLQIAIDGKGAFRRFKDVLMSFAPDRERWFTYRSERLCTFIEAWLSAHCIRAVPRVQWITPAEDVEAEVTATDTTLGTDNPKVFRYRGITALRRTLRELADTLGPRDVETVVSFAEFLKARRSNRFSGYQASIRDSHPGGCYDDGLLDYDHGPWVHRTGAEASVLTDAGSEEDEPLSEREAPRESAILEASGVSTSDPEAIPRGMDAAAGSFVPRGYSSDDNRPQSSS